MGKLKKFFGEWLVDFFRFIKLFLLYLANAYLARWFGGFENVKSVAVSKMYQQRGKYATLFVHAGLVAVMALGVALGPSLLVDTSQTRAVISSALGGKLIFAEAETGGGVFGEGMVSAEAISPLTQVSEKPRSEDVIYLVVEGDTVQSIADKFGVSLETIKWANPGLNIKSIKLGQKITIPPVAGVVHLVKAGETIYSIAKRYSADAQSIVDFPFNTFTNDETFALAIGQRLMVPDGIMPAEVAPAPLRIFQTPNAGAVTATGQWVWPAAGKITQPYRSWHKGIDIANHSGGPILAADAGTVVVAGWPDNGGYGNRVVLNHGNGYLTLYAHMSRIDVVVGQTVGKGDRLGMMGSTGRSTGTHLHFEIRSIQGNLDPLTQLR